MMSKASNQMSLPSLFPCGTKVKVPQLGSEGGGVSLFKPKTLPPFLNTVGNKSSHISKGYIKKISTDIAFSEDVVRDRCFHMLPYDKKYFYEALDLGNLVTKPRKSQIPMSRHNTRIPLSKHMPCHLTKSPAQLKPITPQLSINSEDIAEDVSSKLNGEQDRPVGSPVFITETEAHEEGEGSGEEEPFAKLDSKPGDIPKEEWDAYLMSLLSVSTANWIVHKRMSPSDHQAHLNSLLLNWYGNQDHADLIRDDISEKEFDINKQPDKVQKKSWRKSEASLLDRVYGEAKPTGNLLVSSTDQLGASKVQMKTSQRRLGTAVDTVMPSQQRAVDPYSEDNKAPFYRQPAGLRRQKKNEEKDSAAGLNSTARDIEVVSYQPAPPITLRDVTNPKIKSTLYETENLFQQEWLTGVKQVSNKCGNKTKIVMSSNNTYEKKLQPSFPRNPESWYPDKPEVKARKKSEPQRVACVKKGIQKWKSLPEPVDDTADILSIMSPEYDPDLRGSPDPISRRNTKQNSSMLKILEEWQTQWHLAGQYADSTPDDLIHDMADIQPHVRLKAVATLTKAVTYKPPEEPGIQIEHDRTKSDPLNELPEKIFRALDFLLNDKHEQVKRAAAIALYSLDKPNPQAEAIMREAIKGENSADRWAAAQCLANFGICDPVVVGEIIHQLVTTEDSIKHERAIGLLSKVSTDSMLVHSMVAEHLNSSSWRHKVIACKVFPTLHGNINKDISQKLADLMWNDWHKEVRSAAAQALGKTGHGKIVHDDLRDKILQGPERVRIEAINRVGQLGIMTARLLPSFLQCFDDPYVSVRSEACVTAGLIQIQEPAVIEKLIYRATYDPTWKVKALAVQTLGKIGLASPKVKSCLLWALRYEDIDAVRAEACHSLIILGEDAFDSDDVIDALQERLLVETSDLVRQQITDALKMVGINAADDVDMVADIKDAVRKLCTCDHIASQIAEFEAEEAKVQNKSRMIHRPKEIPKETSSDPAERPPSRREDILKRMKKRSSTPITHYRPPSQCNRNSKASTPEFSRENTLGTPTVDKELQDVMMKEDTESASTPDMDSVSPSTPLSKTRTTRASSAVSTDNTSTSADNNLRAKGEEEDLGNEGEGVSRQVADEPIETGAKANAAETEDLALVDYTKANTAAAETCATEQKDTEETKDEAVQKVGVSFKADNDESITEVPDNGPPVLVIEAASSTSQPFKSQFKLSKSRPHTPGDLSDGLPSRSSSRRRLVSREIQHEKERVQLGAVKSYNDLNFRYSTMTGHLDDVDNAFQGSTGLRLVESSESTGFNVSVLDITSASTSGDLIEN